MKLLLKQDVAKIGKKGQMVEVKEGYARNFLIPGGMAVEASGGALKQIQEEKRASDRHKAKEKEEAQALALRIEGVSILLRHKAGEEGRLFGSITSAEVAQALQREHFDLDKKKIILEEPIRLVGEYEVKIKLHPEVAAHVKVRVQKI